MSAWVKPTGNGGRMVVIDTAHLLLREEIDPAGNIIARTCEVRTPPVSTLTRSPCSGCGGNKLPPLTDPATIESVLAEHAEQ